MRKRPRPFQFVIPAVAKRRAGIHNPLKCLDSCFRGNDGWARCGRLVTLFVSFSAPCQQVTVIKLFRVPASRL
jgi:hypothetical protein